MIKTIAVISIKGLCQGKNKTFDISTLEKQDILVTQVPNLNEAGFFAGMASLIGYIRKYRKDIKIKGIDPFTDYFFKHDYDLKSEFFADFNTYAKQGVVDYDRYEELYEILQIFEKYIKLTKPKIIGFGLWAPALSDVIIPLIKPKNGNFNCKLPM